METGRGDNPGVSFKSAAVRVYPLCGNVGGQGPEENGSENGEDLSKGVGTRTSHFKIPGAMTDITGDLPR